MLPLYDKSLKKEIPQKAHCIEYALIVLGASADAFDSRDKVYKRFNA